MTFKCTFQPATAGVVVLVMACVSISAGRRRHSLDLEPSPTAGSEEAPPHSGMPAEAYVISQIAAGKEADLSDQFPDDSESRVLSAGFLIELLTNTSKYYRVHPHGVQIRKAIVRGKVDLVNREIPYDVKLLDCVFQHCLDFTGSRFHRNLNFDGSLFSGSTDFSDSAIAGDLSANRTEFHKAAGPCDPSDPGDVDAGVFFKSMKVGGDAYFAEALFVQDADLTGAKIEGNLVADQARFSSAADFDNLDVVGDAFFRGTIFDGQARFTDSRFTDLFLNDASFNNSVQTEPTLLTGLKVDTAVFDGTHFQGPIKFEEMACQSISPAAWEKLEVILSHAEFNAESYESLEALLRRHGFSDQASDVYIARKRRERSGLWMGYKVGSYLLDWLFGYGRHLDRLLIWGLAFLGIGWMVFRQESGMQTKKVDDADRCKGKYSGFWYSLDLFVPIVALDQKDIWTPRENRRAARLYGRLHLIIGNLLIPIGLAALTGLIK